MWIVGPLQACSEGGWKCEISARVRRFSRGGRGVVYSKDDNKFDLSVIFGD
jgi:hypothetical protein